MRNENQIINFALFFFFEKMQRDINFKVQFGQNLNLLNDALGIESVDYSADFDGMFKKLNKLKLLYGDGLMDASLLRYIPGMSKIMYQEQTDNIMTRRRYVTSTYTNKQISEFNINLTKNNYTNFSNMLLCLSIKIKKDIMLITISIVI